MKANELFRLLSSDEIDSIVLSACTDDEVPEKLAGGVLTYQGIAIGRFAKLTEVQRKTYVRRTLRDRRAGDLALFVLSAALTKQHPKMIGAFLDEVGLPHKGPHLEFEGEIPEPDAEKVGKGVEALLAKYDARAVALYLVAFTAQPDVSWKALEERLTSDARHAVEDRSSV
jgi:hypothetical protein